MLDKIPDHNDMIALLGEKLYGVWQNLVSQLDDKYDMDCLWKRRTLKI